MTRAEATATAGAALRAVGRWLVRAAVYLGPLLIAAVGYLAKLCADAVTAVRALILRRARAKSPTQLPDYEQREAALRAATAVRWTAWHALPAQRQLAVRVAAVALVVVLAVLLRARFTTPGPAAPPDASADSSPASPAAVFDPAAHQPPPPPPVDMDAAAARFERDARAQAPGQWTFLTEGPVLAPGPRGEFDDFTIASPWVLREGDGGRTRVSHVVSRLLLPRPRSRLRHRPRNVCRRRPLAENERPRLRAIRSRRPQPVERRHGRSLRRPLFHVVFRHARAVGSTATQHVAPRDLVRRTALGGRRTGPCHHRAGPHTDGTLGACTMAASSTCGFPRACERSRRTTSSSRRALHFCCTSPPPMGARGRSPAGSR